MLGKTNDKPVDSELGYEIDQQRTVEFFTEDPQEMMPMSMMSTVFLSQNWLDTSQEFPELVVSSNWSLLLGL